MDLRIRPLVHPDRQGSNVDRGLQQDAIRHVCQRQRRAKNRLVRPLQKRPTAFPVSGSSGFGFTGASFQALALTPSRGQEVRARNSTPYPPLAVTQVESNAADPTVADSSATAP